MSRKILYAVEPGGLSEVNHEQIFAMADRGWKSTRIAREIRRHPSTVQWFMYRNGLAAPVYHGSEPYYRGGRLVIPFDAEQDAFIEALRIQGFDFNEIADLAAKRFGFTRSGHTIFCRLTMLAARESA